MRVFRQAQVRGVNRRGLKAEVRRQKAAVIRHISPRHFGAKYSDFGQQRKVIRVAQFAEKIGADRDRLERLITAQNSVRRIQCEVDDFLASAEDADRIVNGQLEL